MNYTLIFAGGTGQRMNTVSLPKQFLKVQGKEIIVHTIEHFEKNDSIDGIVVVCIERFIPFMRELISKYNLTKVMDVVSGGASGQESIYNGLKYLHEISKLDNDIVLVHDGVRPILDQKTIYANIESVNDYGSAITVAKANETILLLDSEQKVSGVADRTGCYLGRAPQSFYLKDIYSSHCKAIKENKHDFIDSAMLMQYYGYKMNSVLGPVNNIKVTTPMDFYVFKSMLDMVENEQINFK